MRVYALLLGILLTVGSAYIAQVAANAAGPAAAVEPRDLAHPGGPDRIRYGGMLDPITIEAHVATPPASTVTRSAPPLPVETLGGTNPSSNGVSGTRGSIACTRRGVPCGSTPSRSEF